MSQPLKETLRERRQQAAFSLLDGKDFLSVAEEHHISPRTLLAWRDHEYSKWENDPYVGREPGPADDYDGAWPSEEEELSAYAKMKLDPDRFTDPDLRERYAAFLLATQAKQEM